MSKIKIFGLGGLNEIGKNTYVIEIDGKIFIMDAGIKYANDSMYGIDYILPNYKYLEDNKERIVGVFLTHAHQENMGGVFDLVEHLPKIKVYATKYTKELLLMNGMKEKNIVDVVANHKIGFKNVSVFPINVSHSVPDAVMYVINTHDGAIVYTGDFIIDPTMSGAYSMDLGKIAYVGKQGVLCLMAESVFSERKGHTSPHHRLTNWFKDTFNHADGRIIITTLPVHLHTIQEIFDAAKNTHRKIVIMGKKLQNFINFATENNYLTVSKDLIGDLSNINDSNSILLICDDKANAYAGISKIVNGYDKFITLREGDAVVFAEPRYDANEKTIVKLENDLAMAGCKIISLPKSKNILHHASQEDLMLMIKLLNPKYYMPVKGEYRYLVNNANLASELGIPNENIFLKQNGDVITFNDGVYEDKFEHIKVKDILIDGKSSDDIGELVMKDREMLSDNGIVLVSATLSKKDKTLLVGPEITTKGFIYVKDSKDLIIGMKKISEDVILRNINNNTVDYNQIKTDIRSELSNYLYEQTECKPMIIAVVQEV